MVWGCFCKLGVGPLLPIEGTMNANKYKGVLKDYMIPQLRQWFGVRRSSSIFQQDNAPCHKAEDILKYLKEQQIQILEWPPYSPDLSPIENLWTIIKRRLNEEGSLSRNDLEKRLEQLWNYDRYMTPHVNKLIESMPRRIKACIDNNGGPISY